MKIYRCKACGYLHIGEAPEECPMCKAGRKIDAIANSYGLSKL